MANFGIYVQQNDLLILHIARNKEPINFRLKLDCKNSYPE